MSALFEVKNIRKSFGENLVLDDVSIDFPAQSATVIIGAKRFWKKYIDAMHEPPRRA